MFIEIKDARKQYGEGAAMVRALDGASLELDKGKIYVILGPSGSGKSTLMNMLGGLDSLTSGSIVVDGTELGKMNRKSLAEYRRTSTGFVFQSYNLIPNLTVKENIQVVSDIAEHPLDIQEIMEALDIVELASRFPRELSGGQQQRVALARAMIKNPALLLCDELTGALDSKNSKAVLIQIEKMNRIYGTTIIIITHNETIAEMADGVIRIRDGKVTENRENPDKKEAVDLQL